MSGESAALSASARKVQQALAALGLTQRVIELDQPVRSAAAAAVRERTGFAIGGGPPVGHTTSLETFIDQDLLGHGVIWAAAGHPNSLFQLTASELVRIAGGRVVDVR